MRFLDSLKQLLKAKPAEQQTELVYVLLPAAIEPLERGELYEDPLEVDLKAHGLGWISGGGSLLGAEQADGSRAVESCGIDVDTWDLQATLELLRDRLPALKCPIGTQLQYRVGGVPLQDDYDGIGWRTGRPRTAMHPGFGV